MGQFISTPVTVEQRRAAEQSKAAKQEQDRQSDQDLINAFILEKLAELETDK